MGLLRQERRAQEAFAEEARRCSSLQDLLQRWAKMKPGAPLPPAFLQAQQLLRLSESREEEPRAGATEREKAEPGPMSSSTPPSTVFVVAGRSIVVEVVVAVGLVLLFSIWRP
eukprot:s3116_g10.t1